MPTSSNQWKPHHWMMRITKPYLLMIFWDYPRYFLYGKKSETSHAFIQLKQLIENETGQHISGLQTDGGGEFVSIAFKRFCENHDNSRQYTQPHTPPQNGVAERKNRTIFERACCMLAKCKLSEYLWCEAICAANFLVNQSPTVANFGVTPYKRYYQTKPDVSLLKFFGCLAFVHIPNSTEES